MMRLAVRSFLLAASLSCTAARAGPVEVGPVHSLPSAWHGYEATIRQEARLVPVAYETDVLVVGDSLGAVAAAVSAARSGVSVMLVAEFGFLGGDVTAGLRPSLSSREILPQGTCGVFDEIATALANAEALDGARHDPEKLKIVLDELCTAASVKLLLHTFVTGVALESEAITHVIVQNKSGRQAIRAQVIVDATTLARVVRAAEGPERVNVAEPRSAVCTLRALLANATVDAESAVPLAGEHLVGDKALLYPAHGIRRAVLELRRPVRLHPSDPRGLAREEGRSRRQMARLLDALRRQDPGLADAFAANLSLTADVNFGPLVKTVKRLTAQDLRRGEWFRDSVAVTRSAAVGWSGRDLWETEVAQCGCEVPFRCLLARDWQNVLVAPPRLFLRDSERAWLEEPPLIAALGQAAGTAAAMAVKSGRPLDRLDLRALQQQLEREGQTVRVRR